MPSSGDKQDKSSALVSVTPPVMSGSPQPSTQLSATVTPGAGQQPPSPEDPATTPKKPKVVGKTGAKKEDKVSTDGDKDGQKPPEFKPDEWPEFDIIKAIMAMIGAKNSPPIISTIVMAVVAPMAAVAAVGVDIARGVVDGVAGGACKAAGALGVPGASELGDRLLKTAGSSFTAIPGDCVDVAKKVATQPIEKWKRESGYYALYKAKQDHDEELRRQKELETSDPHATPLEVGPGDKDKKATTPLEVASKSSVLDTASGVTSSPPTPLIEPKQPALPIPPSNTLIGGGISSLIPPDGGTAKKVPEKASVSGPSPLVPKHK